MAEASSATYVLLSILSQPLFLPIFHLTHWEIKHSDFLVLAVFNFHMQFPCSLYYENGSVTQRIHKINSRCTQMGHKRVGSQEVRIQNCREGGSSETWSLWSTSFTPMHQLSHAKEMPAAPCTHDIILVGNCSYMLTW